MQKTTSAVRASRSEAGGGGVLASHLTERQQLRRRLQPKCSRWQQPSISKRAPSPILGHTPHILLSIPTTQPLRYEARFPGRPPQRTGEAISPPLILAVVTIRPSDAARSIPFLVVTMTCVACAGGDAVGVESGFLVEGNGEAAMFGTEDVAAVAAVVAAGEEVEGGAAFGGVAVRGLLVGLLEDGQSWASERLNCAITCRCARFVVIHDNLQVET
jgi:hypothetical protein